LSGIQEILLIVLIIVVIWFLPRLGRRGESGEREGRTAPLLGGRARLAVLASGVWAVGAALIWTPWRGDLLPFALIGLGPVALGWGAAWVVLGFRKHR
jgi:hypothetical protein